MKYMMFVCTDTQPDSRKETPDEIGDWFADLESRGKWIAGDRLRPTAEARTVRVRAGAVQVTDGPFTETKELIVGFDILECETLDEAVEIASKHPMARVGRIEVRQFWPHEDT